MIFFLLIWALTTLGFFALASSMSKHQKQLFGKELDASKTKLATIMGWILLIFALVLCLSTGAISNMVSYWIGSLSFAALVVALTLSYAESKAKHIATVCVVLVIISGLISLI